MKIALITLSILSAASAEVVSLTSANKNTVAGKSVFVKFFAPWCGHCKAMASDWEKLAEEIGGGDTVIAEADCTSDDIGDLCKEYGIEGFPTLKYGDISALTDYSGGRGYEDLLEFAKENLKPSCSPANYDLCIGAEKEDLDKFMALSDEDLASKIAKVDSVIAKEDATLSVAVEKLSATYEEMVEKFEQKQNTKKEALDYKLMKAIYKQRAPKPEITDDDDDDDEDDDDDMEDDDDWDDDDEVDDDDDDDDE